MENPERLVGNMSFFKNMFDLACFFMDGKREKWKREEIFVLFLSTCQAGTHGVHSMHT